MVSASITLLTLQGVSNPVHGTPIDFNVQDNVLASHDMGPVLGTLRLTVRSILIAIFCCQIRFDGFTVNTKVLSSYIGITLCARFIKPD